PVADAGLALPPRLAVSVARDETGFTQIRPDRRQIPLFHAEEIDALAARHFDRRNGEFVHDIGEGAQFLGIRHTTPHPRHDGISPVLLNVVVTTLIDEARLAVIDMLARPG